VAELASEREELVSALSLKEQQIRHLSARAAQAGHEGEPPEDECDEQALRKASQRDQKMEELTVLYHRLVKQNAALKVENAESGTKVQRKDSTPCSGVRGGAPPGACIERSAVAREAAMVLGLHPSEVWGSRGVQVEALLKSQGDLLETQKELKQILKKQSEQIARLSEGQHLLSAQVALPPEKRLSAQSGPQADNATLSAPVRVCSKNLRDKQDALLSYKADADGGGGTTVAGALRVVPAIQNYDWGKPWDTPPNRRSSRSCASRRIGAWTGAPGTRRCGWARTRTGRPRCSWRARTARGGASRRT
ncbi:unnamed protein product, partial [Prorocentrum cordatum]